MNVEAIPNLNPVPNLSYPFSKRMDDFDSSAVSAFGQCENGTFNFVLVILMYIFDIDKD